MTNQTFLQEGKAQNSVIQYCYQPNTVPHGLQHLLKIRMKIYYCIPKTNALCVVETWQKEHKFQYQYQGRNNIQDNKNP